MLHFTSLDAREEYPQHPVPLREMSLGGIQGEGEFFVGEPYSVHFSPTDAIAKLYVVLSDAFPNALLHTEAKKPFAILYPKLVNGA